MGSAGFDQIVIIDFETTGLGPTARPVEVAWMQVDQHLHELGRAHSLVNPQLPIEPEASAVSGITDAMVAEAPTLEDFVRVIQHDPFALGHTLVIAHNAAFDHPHITPFCESSESLCTLRLARRMFPVLDNHRLDTLCQHLGLSGPQTHRALQDVEMCAALLTYMVDKVGGGLDGVLALSETALAEMCMPFGKHKNTPIADLPPDYVRWMRAEMRLDGDLKACLDLHHRLT
jgi:DNA polymerase III epsilon subunit-like protein